MGEARDILFRGKRTDNGEWVYGDLLNVGVDYDCAIRTYGGREHGQVNAVNEKTIGQYIALTDKNGTRIFEGDILHLSDHDDNEWNAVVVFGNPYGEYSWGWNFLYIGKKPQVNTDILLWVEMEDVGVYCEIVGNIYDNPELLKGE